MANKLPSHQAAESSRFRLAAVYPYLCAIALRFAMMSAFPRKFMGDAGDFHLLALNVAAGHGLSRCNSAPFIASTVRPPLYPLILGYLYKLGANPDYASILLNGTCDLVSIGLIFQIAQTLKFSTVRYAPWIIALCPLLITYGMYPTTENMSVTLFLAASLLMIRKKPGFSGLFWGLLSLCRSYYLLFPWALALLRPIKSYGKKAYVTLALASLIAPAGWVIRNYQELHRFEFSQTSTAGWQSYLGIARANFDWWKPTDLADMFRHPVFSKMMASHCSQEDELKRLDGEARILVRKFIFEHPFEALRNVAIKTINLFANWGLLMPYDRVPYILESTVNAILCLYWFCAVRLIWRRKKLKGPHEEFLRFSLLNVLYIFLVTLPFSIDARYLLTAFLVLFLCVLEISKKPDEIFKAGLN